MTDYGHAPVIRLPKSKEDRYSNQVNGPVVSETLYLHSLPSTITEVDLHLLLQQYHPLEIQLYRNNGEGYLRFGDASIADQVYALYQDFQFNNGSKLHFNVYPHGHHEAEGMLLKVAHLPRHVDSTLVYHLFRPFGPLALCKLLLEQDDSVFLGTTLIQYFYHEDSEAAIQAMHGQLVHGNKIVVESFMPSGHYQKSSDSSSVSMNPDKPSDPNYVDVMNLYIKNLDPKVTNDDLFDAFRSFGRIVSARVMTNPANNQSKGYGFVSYSRSDEARLALEQMDGKLFYQKPLMVSFHAPKKPRQAPQTPSLQEYPSPYHDSRQQHHHIVPSPNNSTVSSTINGLGIDNVDQLAMDIKDLSIGQQYPSISPYPIQRKSSIADGYMSMQQVRMSPPFSSSPISGSTGHSLASLASGLSIQQPPAQQQQQQQQQSYNLTSTPASGIPQHSPSVQLPGLNTRLTNNKYKQTSDGRPSLRRKSSLESISTVMTESSANLQRHKLTQAVLQCDMVFDNRNLVSDIVDMLMTLKKKERSLCLFNQDFIKAKIELALEALEAFHDGDDSDDSDEEEKALQMMLPRQPTKKSSPAKSTPMGTTRVPFVDDNQLLFQHNPQSDIPKNVPTRVSKAIPIVAPPAITATTSVNGDKKTNTIAGGLSSENRLTKDDKAIVDSIMKSMEGKPSHEKKQLLGDRLFPLVKAIGTKQAPKVTIALLDSVDLLELATMMFDKDTLKKQVDITFAAINQ